MKVATANAQTVFSVIWTFFLLTPGKIVTAESSLGQALISHTSRRFDDWSACPRYKRKNHAVGARRHAAPSLRQDRKALEASAPPDSCAPPFRRTRNGSSSPAMRRRPASDRAPFGRRGGMPTLASAGSAERRNGLAARSRDRRRQLGVGCRAFASRRLTGEQRIGGERGSNVRRRAHRREAQRASTTKTIPAPMCVRTRDHNGMQRAPRHKTGAFPHNRRCVLRCGLECRAPRSPSSECPRWQMKRRCQLSD